MTDLYKIKAKIYKKHEARYIKISKNQLRILESLYVDGSKEKKYFENYLPLQTRILNRLMWRVRYPILSRFVLIVWLKMTQSFLRKEETENYNE